jgi:hypothetical protein
VAVFLGSVVANRGYDDDAGTWSVANIWRSAEGTAWRAVGGAESVAECKI